MLKRVPILLKHPPQRHLQQPEQPQYCSESCSDDAHTISLLRMNEDEPRGPRWKPQHANLTAIGFPPDRREDLLVLKSGQWAVLKRVVMKVWGKKQGPSWIARQKAAIPVAAIDVVRNPGPQSTYHDHPPTFFFLLTLLQSPSISALAQARQIAPPPAAGNHPANAGTTTGAQPSRQGSNDIPGRVAIITSMSGNPQSRQFVLLDPAARLPPNTPVLTLRSWPAPPAHPTTGPSDHRDELAHLSRAELLRRVQRPPPPPPPPPPQPAPGYPSAAFPPLPTTRQQQQQQQEPPAPARHVNPEAEEEEREREFRRWARIRARRDVWQYGGSDDLVQDDRE
ncbi:MAG: hypothetical protein LQ344_005475 [Seirophora lacunosa]|nr:MAG: hypothetical protein LQ344_005475 [Seirophora lacunosa]